VYNYHAIIISRLKTSISKGIVNSRAMYIILKEIR